jgi:RNA polymerase sigma-70 factor (ECF subfamily)
VDDDLAPFIDAAHAAWPTIALTRAAFAARLRDARGASEVPLAELRIADLYLATACAAGEPAAIAILERDILRDVPSFLRRFRAGADFVDEVTQRLRERLLVAPAPAPGGEPTRPRIADYAGRGPLRAWVRVAASRLAIDALREGGAEPGAELLSSDAIDLAPPADLALVHARHRDGLAAAMTAAIESLTRKQRNLLRMHYVDGFTLDRLATAYKVHRATVARWIADARDEILTRAYDQVAEAGALSPSEFESMVAVVRSQIDLSVSRLFR